MAHKKKKKTAKNAPSALNVVPGGVRPGSREGSKPASRPSPSLDDFVEGVLAGDRTILGRAITLIESNVPAHQDQAQELLSRLMPQRGDSIRVGVTGVPGAGKSTFIEALGCLLVERDHKVAVTAVDPTSSISKGSILGDKTRMEELSRNRNAFIRPSPTGGTLGGVARKTRETILLFEAAGFDVIFVETVGVGQSEIAVRSMADFFLLLLVAGAGDELQGLKRGVIELADAVLINKADGENAAAARLACAEYARALKYLRPATEGWETKAFTASSVTGEGVEHVWNVIEEFKSITRASGARQRRRREQAKDWLHQMMEERLRRVFYDHPSITKILPRVEREVMDGELPAVRAAMNLLKTFEDAERRGS